MQEVITLYHLSWYGKATNKPKTTRPPGHTSEWVKQQSTMRKPGIPPARIPEITWHSETQNRVRRWVKKELRWEGEDTLLCDKAMSISRRQRSRKEAMAWGPIEFTVRQHCMVRTMFFCVCCQERAEACLHLRESHALAKDVVWKANFCRRCLFERCKVGAVLRPGEMERGHRNLN